MSANQPLYTKMSKKAPVEGSLKDIERKRREVFKPILDNPFTKGTEWPDVDPVTGKAILDYLIQLLSSYGSYIELQNSGKSKSIPVPDLADKITIGFNSTVKKLETQAAPNREKILKKKKKNPEHESLKSRYTKYVFVAKADISTPLLTSCFPLLTFSASRSLQDRVKLVLLPRGSMERLLKALCTENTCIISLSDDWKAGAALFDLLDAKVKNVEVPWLEGIFGEGEVVFEKPAIKFLKTSAPIGKPKKNNGKVMKPKNE